MEDLLEGIQLAQAELEPQFKALRQAMGALRTASGLAGEETADALPMQKALTKLEMAAEQVENESLDRAVKDFTAATQKALDELAYAFAEDLRQEFDSRGETVSGRPPTLMVGELIFHINMAARKGQWFYGKEALTRPIPLSLKGILKAYDRQVKRIVQRELNATEFLNDIYGAWQHCLAKRKSRPGGGRINIVETYSQLTLNRQSNRFWNAPSRSTFKDYERPLFVRDLVLLLEQNSTTLEVDGQVQRLNLGVATKSQADQASRSIWLPDHGLEGQFYGDITFKPESA